MKKNLIYSGILVGVLLVSLVSAGWFTGNAVDDTVTINVYGNARYDKKFEFDGVTYAVSADFSDDGKEVYLIMTNSELMIVEKLKPLYETGVASFGESFGYMKIEVTRVRESWIRGDYASLVISKGEEPKCKDSDGGVNIYEKGEIRYFYDNPSDMFHGWHVSEDTCSEDGESVMEYSCDYYTGDLHPAKRHNCPEDYLCKDGACIDGTIKKIEPVNHSSMQVTYAGVLEMLNSCKISKYVGSPTTTNCQALCKEGEICVSGIFADWQYDYHGTGGNVVYSSPVSCDEDVKINPPDMESLYCTCCSP